MARIYYEDNLVYAASKALWKAERKTTRSYGFFTRLFSFLIEAGRARKALKGQPGYTDEKMRSIYLEIFRDNCEPAYEAATDLADCVWNFVSRFFRDLSDLAVDIANIFIIAAYYIWSVILWLSDVFQDFLFFCEGYKYELVRALVAVTVSVTAIVFFINSITAYEYSYYGKTLGLARSKSTVYEAINVLGDKLAKSSGANVSLDVERDIEFKRVRGFGLQIDSADDIINTLTYMKDLQVDAYAIYVAGAEKVILEDEATARAVLQTIRNTYAGERAGVEYTDIHYTKDVQVVPVNVKLGELWNDQDATRYLMTGSIKDQEYVVGNYESYNEIAESLGVSVSQLKAANPDVDLESLSPGQVLKLSEPDPIITVASSEVATYYENIEYSTQYIDNPMIYAGETEVKSDGLYGRREVVASVQRINGKEVSRDIISTTKVSDPVDEVLYRGTKPVPETLGTGTFAIPIKSYTVTSRLGWRWGRMHNGIDLAAPTGTKIYAADGGVVTYSGWQNGYGYVVKIDHGGLFETVYAHCSKLIVSAGEKVYQGQNIALVGSTGNSTGPHLHFEVYYNGNVKNPEDYLDF